MAFGTALYVEALRESGSERDRLEVDVRTLEDVLVADAPGRDVQTSSLSQEIELPRFRAVESCDGAKEVT